MAFNNNPAVKLTIWTCFLSGIEILIQRGIYFPDGNDFFSNQSEVLFSQLTYLLQFSQVYQHHFTFCVKHLNIWKGLCIVHWALSGLQCVHGMTYPSDISVRKGIKKQNTECDLQELNLYWWKCEHLISYLLIENVTFRWSNQDFLVDAKNHWPLLFIKEHIQKDIKTHGRIHDWLVQVVFAFKKKLFVLRLK